MITDVLNDDRGGIQKHLLTLTDFLSSEGHEVSIITPYKKNTLIKICGKKIIKIKSLFLGEKGFPAPFPDLLFMWNVKKVIKNTNPDIIHCHGWVALNLTFLKKIKLISTPLVITFHDYWFTCIKRDLYNDAPCDGKSGLKCISCSKKMYGQKSFLIYPLYKLSLSTLNSVDGTISISETIKNKVDSKTNVNKDINKIFPNFLDIKSTDLQKLQTENEINYLLFVGKIMRHKGVEFIYDFFNTNNIYKKYGISLYIVGTPDSSIQLKNRDGIKVIENPSQKELHSYYNNADAVLIPSLWEEPFGIVALEAMFHNKLIIANEVGALSEIIENNNTGMLIKPGNNESLLKAIKFVLNNKLQTKKMALNGNDLLNKKYTSSIVLPKIEDYLEKIILKGKKNV